MPCKEFNAKQVWAQWTWKNVGWLLVARSQSDLYSSYPIQSSNSIITAVNPRTSKSQHLNRLGRLLASNFFFFFLIAWIHTSFCPPDTTISLLEGSLDMTAAYCNDHTHLIHYHHHQHIWDPTISRNFWWLLKMTRDPIKHDMVFRSS